jgi:hypothetical protein
LEIWKQRKPIKNINKKIGMAKTVKNEKTKKMLLTANINQLVISKQLDKKIFDSMDHEFHHRMKIYVMIIHYLPIMLFRRLTLHSHHDGNAFP